MRKLCFLLIITLFITALYGEDAKDKFDFDPPMAPEKPLVDVIFPGIKPKTGFILSTTGIFAGTAITAVSLQHLSVHGANNSFGPDFQRDLIFTSGGLVFSAIFAVFADYFLTEISSEKDSTLKE